MDYGLFIEVNSKGINTVDSQLKNLNKTMDDTAKKSDRVEQGLNPQNVNRFTQSVRGANTEVSALNKSLNTISTLVASGMFLGMARSCITAAQEVASLKAQIRVLGEEVDSTYQNLKDFSLTTAGLDTQGVVKAYASFRRLNYSTEESKSNIEALGKGLASFGTTNGLSNVMIQMEQLANRTSGFTQDLNAISNYLMDARAIVKEKYGVSDFEDLTKMGVNGRDIVDTLIQNYSKLDKPADDINMQMNRLNATIQDIKANIGGVFAGFIPQIQRLSDYLGVIANSPFAQSIAAGVVQTTLLYNVFSKIKNKTAGIVEDFKSVNSNVGNEFKQLSSDNKSLRQSENDLKATKDQYKSIALQELKIAQNKNLRVTAQLKLNELADKYVRAGRLAVNSEAQQIAKDGILLQLETQIVRQRDKIAAANRKILASEEAILKITQATAAVDAQRSGVRTQRSNVAKAIGGNLKSAGATLFRNSDAIMMMASSSVASFLDNSSTKLNDSFDKLIDKYDGVNGEFIKKLEKTGKDIVKNAAFKGLADGANFGASLGMMTGNPYVGLIGGAISAMFMAEQNATKAMASNNYKVWSKGVSNYYGGMYAGLHAQADNIKDVDEQEYAKAYYEHEQKKAEFNYKAGVYNDKHKKRDDWWEAFGPVAHAEISNLNAMSEGLTKEYEILENENKTLAEKYKLLQKIREEKQKAQIVADKDTQAEIDSLKYKANGDDYNSQLVMIQRAYDKVIENEKSSNLEKQKALLVLQEQTKELNKQTQEIENQKKIQEMVSKKEIESTKALFSGDSYQAEIIQAESNYLKVAQDITSTIYDRVNAYNEYRIAVNKAELNKVDRENTLYSAKDRFYGNNDTADKRDLFNKYFKVVGDITADNTEKETAYWNLKSGLLDKAIGKIKSYFSTYIQGLQEIIQKRRETTDGVISEIKRERDSVLGIYSQGQQALMSSGYFAYSDTTDQYSRDEIMRGFNRYNTEKANKERQFNLVDQIVNGGNEYDTVQGMESIIKGYENLNKYIEQNNISGANLFDLLSTLSPYIKGSYELFRNAFNEQMAL